MPRILRTPGSRGKRIMGLRLAWDMWTDYIRKKKSRGGERKETRYEGTHTCDPSTEAV